MAITAQDIEEVSFSISKKGYDVDEVDVFLEHVAAEIDNLNKLVAKLSASKSNSDVDHPSSVKDKNEFTDNSQVDESNGQLPSDSDDYQDEDVISQDPQIQGLLDEKDKLIESLQDKLNSKTVDDSAISQALIVAQRSADEIIAKANSKADSAIDEAHDEAEKIISRAEEEKESIMKAIAKLEEDKEDSRNGYADLLRDLINDASTKLNSLGFQQSLTSEDENIDSLISSGSHVLNNEVAGLGGVDIDSDNKSGISANSSSFVEKDMSGFGEIADDDDLD